MLVFELIGAIVGAGLASGREIASFFARYGIWGYAGILLAVAVLVCLGSTEFPAAWKGHWQEIIWKGLLTLLLVTTGGAMLAGSGEIASLVLPVHGANWLGMAGTLLIAWMLANRTIGGLSWVSRIMLGVFAVMICMGFAVPAKQASNLQTTNVLLALIRGASYGGFNAALLIPVLSQSPKGQRRNHSKDLLWAGGMMLLLLLLGNAVLIRNSALLYEPMPFVLLLSHWGKWGYYMSAGCLYLAILSTLTACLRGLGKSTLSVVGIILVALLGFNGVVDHVYSLLGGACFIMLVMAKFRNCSRM